MRRQLEQGTPPPIRDQVMVEDIEVKVTAHTPAPTPDPDSPAGTLSPTATPTPAKAFLPRLPDPVDQEFSVTINSVPSGSSLDIHWEYFFPPTPKPTPTPAVTPTHTPTPESAAPGGQSGPPSSTEDDNPTPTPTSMPTPIPPSIKVYGTSDAGAEETPTPIATSVRCSDDPHCSDDLQDDRSEDYIWVRYEAPSTGDIRIVFYSGTERVRTRRDRSPSCPNENGKTLCVIAMPRFFSPTGSSPALQEDYVVVSKAGNTTVTAYIRWIIRWSRIPAADGVIYSPFYDDVTILSWKPYPPDPPDEDEEP